MGEPLLYISICHRYKQSKYWKISLHTSTHLIEQSIAIKHRIFGLIKIYKRDNTNKRRLSILLLQNSKAMEQSVYHCYELFDFLLDIVSKPNAKNTTLKATKMTKETAQKQRDESVIIGA